MTNKDIVSLVDRAKPLRRELDSCCIHMRELVFKKYRVRTMDGLDRKIIREGIFANVPYEDPWFEAVVILSLWYHGHKLPKFKFRELEKGFKL